MCFKRGLPLAPAKPLPEWVGGGSEVERSLSNQPLSSEGREELGASWMKQSWFPHRPTKSKQRHHQVVPLGFLCSENMIFNDLFIQQIFLSPFYDPAPHELSDLGPWPHSCIPQFPLWNWVNNCPYHTQKLLCGLTITAKSTKQCPESNRQPVRISRDYWLCTRHFSRRCDCCSEQGRQGSCPS